MSTSFPGALDALTNPAATDGLTGHAAQHANANDAIEALEAKVGVDNSTDPASLDYRVATLESGGGGGIWGSITGALSDQTDLQAALNWKLSASATTDAIAEGATNQYFTSARVRAVVLAGLSTATNAVITAADSVLTAFGKLQKQISDNLTTLTTHTGSTSNPHSVTKAQVGLNSVDNTADVDKPVSTAQQTALNLKAPLASPTFTGLILATNSLGLGYGPGAGGTVTQATSKSTAVTLNKPSGQITMNNAALAAGASITFVLNNSLISDTDVLSVAVVAGQSSYANYRLTTVCLTGLAAITVWNTTGGSLSEAVALQFVLHKGAVS